MLIMKSRIKKERITISLTPKLLENVKTKARDSGMSVSMLIEFALREKLRV